VESPEAFEIIRRELASQAETELLSTDYDPVHFGNFIISFTLSGTGCSVVCDRGEIVFCHSLHGKNPYEMIAPSLTTANADELRQALRAALGKARQKNG